MPFQQNVKKYIELTDIGKDVYASYILKRKKQLGAVYACDHGLRKVEASTSTDTLSYRERPYLNI